jgi:hypothetical protein
MLWKASSLLNAVHSVGLTQFWLCNMENDFPFCWKLGLNADKLTLCLFEQLFLPLVVKASKMSGCPFPLLWLRRVEWSVSPEIT